MERGQGTGGGTGTVSTTSCVAVDVPARVTVCVECAAGKDFEVLVELVLSVSVLLDVVEEA